MAQNNAEVAQHLFRDRVMTVIASVEQAYWELVFANENLKVAQADLFLELRRPDGEVHDYRRDLDLAQAVATVSYSIGGVRFTREVIASHADNVIAVRLTADKPGNVSFKMRFRANREPSSVTTRGNDALVIAADARETRHSDGKTGVVWVKTIGSNQRGKTVLEYYRWVMVNKRDPSVKTGIDQVPTLPESVAPADLPVPESLNLSRFEQLAWATMTGPVCAFGLRGRTMSGATTWRWRGPRTGGLCRSWP